MSDLLDSITAKDNEIDSLRAQIGQIEDRIEAIEADRDADITRLAEQTSSFDELLAVMPRFTSREMRSTTFREALSRCASSLPGVERIGTSGFLTAVFRVHLTSEASAEDVEVILRRAITHRVFFVFVFPGDERTRLGILGAPERGQDRFDLGNGVYLDAATLARRVVA